MTEKNKAYLRIGSMVVVFLLSVGGIFLYKPIWAKVIFAIISGILGYILYRTYLSFKRKKYYLEGKILSVVKPKNKFGVGKTVVIIKAGKVSKKIYSWQPITMKIGGTYGIYYEEKSNQIIKYQSLQKSMMVRPNRANIPPQYR